MHGRVRRGPAQRATEGDRRRRRRDRGAAAATPATGGPAGAPRSGRRATGLRAGSLPPWTQSPHGRGGSAGPAEIRGGVRTERDRGGGDRAPRLPRHILPRQPTAASADCRASRALGAGARWEERRGRRGPVEDGVSGDFRRQHRRLSRRDGIGDYRRLRTAAPTARAATAAVERSARPTAPSQRRTCSTAALRSAACRLAGSMRSSSCSVLRQQKGADRAG